VHEGSKKAIVAAFFANLGIAVAKFVAFLFTGAASMLAESIHSLADTGNQGLLMLGTKRASRPADESHPFGYSMSRYFWAFVVALVLFSLGGVFAMYEGIDKLLHPHEVESPVWAIGVLVFAIGLESYSFRTAWKETKPLLQGRSMMTFIRRSKSPELPVVLLEDTGALLGLVVALVGVITAAVTDNSRWDAAGSLAIGVLLVVIAIVLAIEMSSLLIGEAAEPDRVQEIKRIVNQHETSRSLVHLRTMHLGPDDIMVAAKVAFDPQLSLAEVARAIDSLEVEIRAVMPEAKMLFIEPDVQRQATD
jgi:cation diffusion facilitator family transporter